MAKILNGASEALVVLGDAGGRTLVPVGTPLTRLNYFDGKFLRADDLRAEQDYVRSLVHLSNRAGGRGVVHGLDVAVDGDRLTLSAGMAVDGEGRLLLLPGEAAVGVSALLEASRRAAPGMQARVGSGGLVGFTLCEEAPATDPQAALPTRGLYLLILAHAEALCGHEDVYGRLCDDGCARPSERPWRLEGVVLRALPLALETPLATSSAVTLDSRHLRSRVASAYFADARRSPASLVSGEGLRSAAWCRGAEAPPTGDVALGVLARLGDTTLFLDAWTARRERMEAPPRRYWAHRMAMRPWDLFLAEILQFQCQLGDLLDGSPTPAADPCADERDALKEASRYVEALRKKAQSGGAAAGADVRELSVPSAADALPADALADTSELERLGRRLGALLARRPAPSQRILVERGIVELPSAGYLPVDPASDTSLDRQVRALVGEGLDLRFCAVRPDFVAHALEEAQHMDRISLLQGLDDPGRKPEVDVLVPDGAITAPELDVGGLQDVRLVLRPPASMFGNKRMVETVDASAVSTRTTLRGAARAAAGAAGGGSVRIALSPEDIPDLVGTALMRLAADAARSVTERENAGSQPTPGAADAAGATTGEATATGAGSTGPTGGTINEVTSEMLRRAIHVRPEVISLAAPEAGAAVRIQVERNPFDLAPGDSVQVGAELTLGIAVGLHAVTVEVTVDGRARLASVSGAAGELRQLRGRLTRMRVVMTPYLDGQAGALETQLVDFPFEADLRTTADGPVEAALRLDVNDGVRVVTTGTWTGAGVLEGAVDVQEAVNGETRTWALARGVSTPDASVADPGHAAHRAAVAAMDIIARGLRDAGYREEMEAALFGGGAPKGSDPVVRGPHGWVLFHRRRTKTCGAAEAVTTLPTRRYRVLHLAVEDAGRVKAIRDAVAQGDAGLFRKLPPEAVTTVAFQGGLADLASPSATLVTAWAALEAGPVAYGLLAPSALPGEGDPGLARSRLGRVEGLVDENADGPPPLEVLDAVPAGLDAGDADGVVLLVTLPRQVATLTHQVFDVSAEARGRLLKLVQSEGIDTGPNSAFASLTRPLGSVTFRSGTATLEGAFPQDVLSAWKEAHGEGVPGQAAVAAPAGSSEPLERQALSVASGLGGSPGSAEKLDVPAGKPFPFDAATFITAQTEVQPVPRTARIYAFQGPDDDRSIVVDDSSLVLSFNPDGSVADPGVTDAMARILRKRAPYMRLELATREANPDEAAAKQRLESVMELLGPLDMMDPGASAALTTLSDFEQGLLDRDGVTVDDVLLLAVSQ